MNLHAATSRAWCALRTSRRTPARVNGRQQLAPLAERPPITRVGLAAAIAAALLASVTTSASALTPYDQLSSTTQQQIVDVLERGGATEPYYTQLSTAENGLHTLETISTDAQLARDLAHARFAIGVLPQPIGSFQRIDLSTGPLSDGWMVGSGPYAKWIHLGGVGGMVPTDDAGVGWLQSSPQGVAAFNPTIDTTPESAGLNPVLFPVDGYYLQFPYHNQTFSSFNFRSDCSGSINPPSGLSSILGYGFYWCYVPSYPVKGWYIDQWDLVDRPVEDGANQDATFTTPAPTRPLRADEESHAASFFADSANSHLLSWFEHNLTADSPDPYADAAIAAHFRPLLLFDSLERFRPLNIDKFLAERNSDGSPAHCVSAVDPVTSERACHAVQSVADMMQYNVQSSYLDVKGTFGSPETYSSPGACHSSLDVQFSLQDCDPGDNEAMYYHIDGPSPGGYRYIDYWFFYRYNGNQEGLTPVQHEGDWESVTVAPSLLSSDTFDFASFSAHGTWYNYLRAGLICDGAPPDTGASCGSNTSGGQRVWDFVANGSQANYAWSCSSLCPDPALDDLPVEGNHDGAAPWGVNGSQYDNTALQSFGDLATGTFNDWVGHWGIPDGEGGPVSPSSQPHYTAPWSGNQCASDNGNCALPSRARRPDAASRAKLNASCATWFGPGVAATECAPTGLRSALAHRRLGKRGPLTLRIVRGGERAASRARQRSAAAAAPGMAQALGAPLAVGDTLRISAAATGASTLLVRVQVGKRVVPVPFTNLRLPRGHARLTVSRGPKGLNLTLTGPRHLRVIMSVRASSTVRRVRR
jgi:hypothetical protein